MHIRYSEVEAVMYSYERETPSRSRVVDCIEHIFLCLNLETKQTLDEMVKEFLFLEKTVGGTSK